MKDQPSNTLAGGGGPQVDLADLSLYDVNVEFYDMVATPMWETMGPALTAALAHVDPSAGPVLEIGAGTGLATVVIADALPTVRIVALEPSRAMRAVLHSRLFARPGLRERVTVLPTGFADAPVPDRLGGAVAMAVLGHLPPSERRRLWALLAERLAPGAPAVVHLLPPERPTPCASTMVARTRLGDLEYEAWAEAEPVGERTLRWTMTYRVRSDGEEIEARSATSDYETVGVGDVTAEAGSVGLSAVEAEAGLVILTGS